VILVQLDVIQLLQKTIYVWALPIQLLWWSELKVLNTLLIKIVFSPWSGSNIERQGVQQCPQ